MSRHDLFPSRSTKQSPRFEFFFLFPPQTQPLHNLACHNAGHNKNTNWPSCKGCNLEHTVGYPTRGCHYILHNSLRVVYTPVVTCLVWSLGPFVECRHRTPRSYPFWPVRSRFRVHRWDQTVREYTGPDFTDLLTESYRVMECDQVSYYESFLWDLIGNRDSETMTIVDRQWWRVQEQSHRFDVRIEPSVVLLYRLVRTLGPDDRDQKYIKR